MVSFYESLKMIHDIIYLGGSMASSIIHVAVAKKINEKLHCNEELLIMGTVAPDVSKHANLTKNGTHFLTDDTDIPNIDIFLQKYKSKLTNDFVMGYFIHLYTDYFWFKNFIPDMLSSDQKFVTKLNGDVIPLNGSMLKQYIYNDYQNININLINKYDIDLEYLYHVEAPNIIEEIPYEYLNKLFDYTVSIVKKASNNYQFVFDMQCIDTFINTCAELIYSEILEIMR